jgi:hypothetical protein
VRLALKVFMLSYIHIFLFSIYKTMRVLSTHTTAVNLGLLDFASLSCYFNFGVVILTDNA